MKPKSLFKGGLVLLFIDKLVAASSQLQQLGGNSPWFEGPNVFGIDSSPPEGCSIDMAAFVSRHGSRYPDPSAYYQWTNLSAKIHSASFTTSGPLEFLSSWEPVLPYPDQELSQISIGGYKELYDMGAKYRLRYRQLYKDNTGFDVFANQYPAAPRVIDSARLFARGLMGPNSTLGDVYVIKSSDPRAFANSLAPSDLCSAYKDNGGGDYLTTWENVYLPPITERVNGMIQGNLTFTDDDVSIFPYLCGFETQITGRPSPWCNIFTQAELEQYEYAQDLRYYYGSGPGSGKNSTLMLPVLNAVIRRLQDGPGRTYVNSENETWTPPALIAMFTNDGQINQLASSIGVFDAVKPLSPTSITESIYVASHYVSMRGTISFERLNCGAGMYVRLLLNDVVYPVASCQDGPGRSCSLQDYASLIANKSRNPLAEICSSSGSGNRTDKATFLTDNALPWEYIVKP